MQEKKQILLTEELPIVYVGTLPPVFWSVDGLHLPGFRGADCIKGERAASPGERWEHYVGQVIGAKLTVTSPIDSVDPDLMIGSSPLRSSS